MKVRTIKLLGGPCDGSFTVASDMTAWHQGELYVYCGDEDQDLFRHAITFATTLPDGQRGEEAKRVSDWMNAPLVDAHGHLMLPPPMSCLIGIPPWRINMWWQIFTIGEQGR